MPPARGRTTALLAKAIASSQPLRAIPSSPLRWLATRLGQGESDQARGSRRRPRFASHKIVTNGVSSIP